jgi:hypothetical protein
MIKKSNNKSNVNNSSGSTIAEKEFSDNLRKIQHFISGNQTKALQDIFKGEESEYAQDIVKSLSGIIENMPSSYETEDTDTPDKIVYLHYFYGASNWYIIEKDKGSPDDPIQGIQQQAYGYVILNGDTINAEWGYISIQELIQNNVELNFHFEPIKFSELKKKWPELRNL